MVTTVVGSIIVAVEVSPRGMNVDVYKKVVIETSVVAESRVEMTVIVLAGAVIVVLAPGMVMVL